MVKTCSCKSLRKLNLPTDQSVYDETARITLQSDSVTVTTSADGHVATVTIPGGVLEARTAAEINEACRRIQEEREIRVVVLKSLGPDFCTGLAENFDPKLVYPDPATAVSALTTPVVCLLSGLCSSGGLEIALACDIRIGTPDSCFSLTEPTNGLLPMWGGTQRLPRAISQGRAASMLLLGTEIDATTAQLWGLLHSIEQDDGFELAKTVESLMACGPLALQMAKEAVHRGSELPLRDGLRLEGDLNHQLAATDDRAEGLAAFFSKRPPDFSGR